MAMAYGFNTDEAKRLTTAMTDFAAGSGASSYAMDKIALALGQIRARGTLAGQEINQLTEAGIPVREILAKSFGVTTAELVAMQEKGLIPADKAIEAIVSSLENDFGGAAARQATTFSGLISSLNDIKSVGLRTFFEGTFQAIQPLVENFVGKFSDPAFMNNLREMGQGIGDFINTGISAFQLFRSDLDAFQQSPVFQTITENFKKIFDVVTQPQVLEGARSIFDGIMGFLQDLGARAVPFALEMIGKFGTWFQENGPLIGAYVTGIADYFNNFLLPALLLVWDVASPILGGFIDLLLGIAETIMRIATGDWPGAWNTILDTLVNVGAALWDSLEILLNGIATMMGTSGDQIKTIWSNNWEMLKTILSQVWSIIQTNVRNYLMDVRNALAQAGSEIEAAWQTAWNNVATYVSTIWSSITSTVSANINNVISALLDMLSELADAFDPGKFSELGQNIAEGILDGIQGAWGGIADWVINQINTLISSALGGLTSFGGDGTGTGGGGTGTGGGDLSLKVPTGQFFQPNAFPAGAESVSSGGDTFNFYAPITVQVPEGGDLYDVLKLRVR